MDKTYMTIVSITFTIFSDEDPKALDIMDDIEIMRDSVVRAGNGHMDMLNRHHGVTMINSASSIQAVEGDSDEVDHEF